MHNEDWMWDVDISYGLATIYSIWRCSFCMIIVVTNQRKVGLSQHVCSITYRSQCPQQSYQELIMIVLTLVHMMWTCLLSCHWVLMRVVKYEWRGGHAVWFSHELLMEMGVITLYSFVGDYSIQTRAVDDQKQASFLMLKVVIL